MKNRLYSYFYIFPVSVSCMTGDKKVRLTLPISKKKIPCKTRTCELKQISTVQWKLNWTTTHFCWLSVKSLKTDKVESCRFYETPMTHERQIITGGLRRVAIPLILYKVISVYFLLCLKYLFNLCLFIGKVKISEIDWKTMILQRQFTNFFIAPLITKNGLLDDINLQSPLPSFS